MFSLCTWILIYFWSGNYYIFDCCWYWTLSWRFLFTLDCYLRASTYTIFLGLYIYIYIYHQVGLIKWSSLTFSLFLTIGPYHPLLLAGLLDYITSSICTCLCVCVCVCVQTIVFANWIMIFISKNLTYAQVLCLTKFYLFFYVIP